MKKEFKVEGMMWKDWGMDVEKGLKSMEGVDGRVRVKGGVGVVEFWEGEKRVEELEGVVRGEGGE